MANIKVKDLTDTQTINTDDEIMVLTDENSNLVQNITVENFITNVISSDSDNVIEQGADGKLFVETPVNITGNLSNLTTTNKSTLVGAINEVDGDVGNLANLTTSVKTNVVNAINSEVSARNTAETNIQNDYNGKIGTLSNLDTTDKSNIVGAINELAAIAEPSLQYETMNNSKALETGAPSENAIILANVQKYAHSTFDRSKFTVIGSPIITDDGIASGFSSSNYITINTPTQNKPFNFKMRLKLSTISTYESIFYVSDTNGRAFYLYQNYNDKLQVNYRNSAGETLTYGTLTSQIPSINNAIADIEGIITDTTFTCRIKVNDFVYTTDVAISGLLSGNGTWSFLRYYPESTASIDLKQFSITVDGVPVFSGNKTGLSVIKPDNYTVVGSPTISADGIASGFSTSNYLTATLNNNPTSSVEFECKFKIASDLDSATAQDIVRGSGFVVLYAYFNSRRRVRVRWGSSSDNNLWDDIYYDDFAVNTWYVAKGHYDVATKTSTLYLYDDNGNQLATHTATLTGSTFVSGDFSAYIGTNGSSTSFSGSIDLNVIKLSVDGKLVYQSCLKIPYTESFTGSKIVDAIYRDRVVDAYEQGYPQRFYTLQEDKKGNYTVVGSPTISSDFVASGFSNSNYIQGSANINSQNFKIEFEAENVSDNIGQRIIQFGTKRVILYTNSCLIYDDTIPGNVVVGYFPTETQANDKLFITLSGDSTGTKAVVKNITRNVERTGTGNSYTLTATSFTFFGGANNSYSGSTDLKQFKIYVDDELAYEAVSDPNFTLPLGEIYGDIEYNRANKLDLTTANATQETVSKINGWCIPDYANGIGKVVNTVYQAAKNVYVKILNNTDGGAAGYIYIGTTNNPATEIAQWGGNVATANTIYYMIPKGYYYKISGTGIYSITEFPFMGE